MPRARCNGIEIAYEIEGPEDGAPLLLIHGVGAQLVSWPGPLLAALRAAGFRVIRFDNRDVGLSTHLHGSPVPDPARIGVAMRRGGMPKLPYSLSDMAADAAGLLDALGIAATHVVGVSLGGMIAQMLAIGHPGRVRSLAIVMSHTGNPDLPGSDPVLLRGLAAAPPDPVRDQEGYLDHMVALSRAFGSPDHPIAEADIRAAAAASAARAFDPAGAGRQLAAALGAPDRRAGLRALAVPTLVVHGAADPLIPPAGGQDLAAAVTGAWLLLIGGMGHDLPEALNGLLVGTIAANASRSMK